MGIFADSIGDLPGNEAGVRNLAADLKIQGESIARIKGDYDSSPTLALSWEGEAADAFDRAFFDAKKAFYALEDGLEDGQRALERFADALKTHNDRVDQLRDEARGLDIRWESLTPQEQMDQLPKFQALLAAYSQRYNERINGVRDDSVRCAADLRNALHIEAENLRDNPNTASVENIADLESFSSRDIGYLAQAIANMDPYDVRQGGIGDCYYLASLISMMNSEEGKRFLQSCIEPHYGPNGNIDGYYVTIYDDPTNPNPDGADVVLVTSYYPRGTLNASGKAPSVASLFEVAYAQGRHHGTGSSTLWRDGISGGFGSEAMEDLTGVPSTRFNRPILNHHYSPEVRGGVTETLDSGRPVTAGTVNSSIINSDPVPVTATYSDANGRQKAAQVEIIRSHEYAVIRADDNSITLINPWGHNPSAGGNGYAPSEITLSWEEFERAFDSIDVGGGYP
ncbi:WXG100 family type VII secretion target [Schaalia vaccimaxillae]|uniref:WXG100 family type VII secretion target n=1 Tax=Schaalia vaccimaxillae TaxID=183916 RepID=UPI0003B78A7A|nr:WXG100 family type VII secretion target [Schaalia vaccimaxillae]